MLIGPQQIVFVDVFNWIRTQGMIHNLQEEGDILVPATREAEKEGSLEAKSSRPAMGNLRGKKERREGGERAG